MHPFAKLLLFILFLPLILCVFFVFLPLLILILLLGFFFPVLRFSYKRGSFGGFPGRKHAEKTDRGEPSPQEDVCDIECTVLHSETVREETPGGEELHKLNQ